MIENVKIWVAATFFALGTPAWSDAFPVQRCVNLANALEAPREGDWGYKISDEDIARVAQDGFDTIRLPVRFSAHFDDGLNPEILERTDHVIQTALDLGLYVILDLHHFHPLSAAPEAHSDTFQAIWAELGKHYKDWPPELMFELLNEPEGNLTTAKADALYDTAIATLRADHPDRWIIVGGGDWSDWRQLRNLKPRDARVMHTFHYYAPFDFTHQTADWVEHPPPLRGPVTSQELEKLTAEITALARHPRPLFLGEFGAYNIIAPKDRATWTKAVRKAAEAANISWCHWGHASGFRLLDKQGEWLPHLHHALFGK